MTRDEFSKLLAEIQEKEIALRVAGQAEYSGGEDAFGNFKRLGTALGLPPEKVLWVYLVKHLDGILAWINGHKSQREDVRGRIADARLYLALLHGMADEQAAALVPGGTVRTGIMRTSAVADRMVPAEITLDSPISPSWGKP